MNESIYTKLGRLLEWRPGKLAKGSLSMSVGMGLRTLFQCAVFLIIAHVLGVETYGAYTAVLALSITFGGFVGLGAPLIMLRDTARNTVAFTESWGRALAALLLTAPPLLFVYFFLSWAILPRQIAFSVVACIGITEIVLSPLTFAAIRAYQGHERIGRAARVTLLQTLPRLAAALLMLSFAFELPAPKRLPVWTVLYLLASASSTVYVLRLLRRDLGVSIKLHWYDLSFAMREGWPFSVAGAAQKVYSDIDKVMLARLSTLGAAGAYSAAYRFMEMASIPLFSFFSAATPRFFRAGRDGTHSAAGYAMRVLPLPMIFALAVSVALYTLSGSLTWLLGTEFAPAENALRWLAWLPMLTTSRYFMQTVFNASGRQRIILSIVVSGATLNILLNIWMIQWWSWRGAVIATYISEISMNIFLVLASVHERCKMKA